MTIAGVQTRMCCLFFTMSLLSHEELHSFSTEKYLVLSGRKIFKLIFLMIIQYVRKKIKSIYLNIDTNQNLLNIVFILKQFLFLFQLRKTPFRSIEKLSENHTNLEENTIEQKKKIEVELNLRAFCPLLVLTAPTSMYFDSCKICLQGKKKYPAGIMEEKSLSGT